jgi:hypothetical protein
MAACEGSSAGRRGSSASLRSRASWPRGGIGRLARPCRPHRLPTTTSEPVESLEERRARVHAKAQEALEAMDDLEEPA